MTDRRHAHTTRQRHDNAADTDTRHACAGNPWPYDVLIDLNRGREYEAALAEAKRICGTCPLFEQCFTANRGEPWVEAMLGRDRRRAPQPRRDYVSPAGREKIRANNARYAAEFNAARYADIVNLLDAGYDLPAVAARLHISRDSLRVWCRRNGHTDLWVRLGGRPSKARTEVAA